MSNSNFTPKDIIASKKKHGDSRLLKADIANTRKNKNPKQPTFYIPITFKNVAGKPQAINLKFVRQLISSNAKLPYGAEANEAKFLNVSFKKLAVKDLEGTEYPEEKKEGLISANEEFIEALGIIADDYLACVKEEILKYKGDKFRIIERKTNCFRQDRRVGSAEDENQDDDGKVAIDPIYRIRLEADPETKKIGRASDRGHQYVVFDMRKSEKEAKETGKPKRDIVARVMVKGKPVDLNINNAKHFVSFMSLTSGVIHFECICISRSGISIKCRFRNLHVWRHKTMKQESLGEEDRDDMAAYGYQGGEDEDLDVNVDEPEDEDDAESGSKSKSKGKQSSKSSGKSSGKPGKALSKALNTDDDDEQPIDDEPADEPEENDVDDQDDAPPAKKTPPKVANKTAPASKNTNATKPEKAKPAKPSKAESKSKSEEKSDNDDNGDDIGDNDGGDEPAENDGDDNDNGNDDTDTKPTKNDGGDDEPAENDDDDEESKPATKSKGKPPTKGASLKGAPKKK